MSAHKMNVDEMVQLHSAFLTRVLCILLNLHYFRVSMTVCLRCCNVVKTLVSVSYLTSEEFHGKSTIIIGYWILNLMLYNGTETFIRVTLNRTMFSRVTLSRAAFSGMTLYRKVFLMNVLAPIQKYNHMLIV
jgi:hypothetical protein